jgi:hypothetical protein
MERCSWLRFEPSTSFAQAGDEVPEPEDEGAVVNQRRAEKIQRLVQLYSTMDLTGLSARQRVHQEQEMRNMYVRGQERGLAGQIAGGR